MKKINISPIKTTGLTLPSLIDLMIFFYHFDEKNQNSTNESIQVEGFINYDLLSLIFKGEISVSRKTFSSKSLSIKSITKLLTSLARFFAKEIEALDATHKKDINSILLSLTNDKVNTDSTKELLNFFIIFFTKFNTDKEFKKLDDQLKNIEPILLPEGDINELEFSLNIIHELESLLDNTEEVKY